MSNYKNTTVRHLQAGDTFGGSGFKVARRPYTSVRCPKGKLHVEGNYPGQPVTVHLFNASTTVSVTTS